MTFSLKTDKIVCAKRVFPCFSRIWKRIEAVITGLTRKKIRVWIFRPHVFPLFSELCRNQISYFFKNSCVFFLRFPALKKRLRYIMESCPRGRRCNTRNFLKSWPFAPLKKPVKSGVFSGSKIEYFVVLSVSSFQKFLEEIRNHIHGELSEWSKVQHSKSCYFLRKLNIYYTEAYRSGHNELHSKCSCPKGHVGSNPTLSAMFFKKPRSFDFV